MAGSWLDALLGAIFNSGTAVPISGGLNFTGGLRAVLNRSTARVDASLVNPPNASAVQVAWSPVDGDSDTLEVLAAGHDPGFYLVGTAVTFTAEPSDGTFAPTLTWSDGSADGEIIGDAMAASAIVTAPPQLVYSDGSAAITITWAPTTTDEMVAGTVRANALRVSG